MEPPRWFADAIAYPYTEGSTEVAGARIHYLRWRPPPLPVSHTLAASGKLPQGLIFVHGAGAHAHWWAHIAPLLASEGLDVVALSLSGHGDSGSRSVYDEEVWSDEILGVCRHAEFFGSDRCAQPIVVGHSLGSYSVLRAAQRWPDLIGAAIITDSGVPHPYFWNSAETNAAFRKTIRGAAASDAGPRIHPKSRPVRVTLQPPQRTRLPYILDHIASKSWVAATRPDGEQGWRWKFDHLRQSRSDFISSIQIGTPEIVNALRTRVGIIYGEESVIVNPPTQQLMRAKLGAHIPMVSIPDAEHHLFLDQPLAFVTTLRTMIGEWQRSSVHLAPLLLSGGDGQRASEQAVDVLPPMGGRPAHGDWDRERVMAQLEDGAVLRAIQHSQRIAASQKQRRPGARL